MADKTLFEVLNKVNVSDKTEKKNGLTYLSWAFAWGELKKAVPDAKYTIYENPSGWNYHTDGKTCWVKCGVTANDIEYIEYLPIMDFKNKSIPLENITSMDVTKSIQRCITKAIARHGLGLFIYQGEDLPEEAMEARKESIQKENSPMSSEHKVELLKEMTRTGMKMDALLKWAKVKLIDDLTEHQWATTIQQLKTFPDAEAKGEANADNSENK